MTSDAKPEDRSDGPRTIALFLCGDVMLGRGIDQVLPSPSDPRLYESYVSSAEDYVELAERAHGRIPRPVDYTYVWGDALLELDRARPDARIVNLETSITTSNDAAPKGINYRMHPLNIRCLNAAGIDCCVLANNHVLDWGRSGLDETLATLRRAGIRSAGAGPDLAQAERPATLDLAGGGRVLVFAFGATSSGIPNAWAARANTPGVNLLQDLSKRTVLRIAEQARTAKRPGDLLVASVHWGENWGHDIPDEQRRFAHGLIEMAGFDVVHGHSSHHAKAIEVFQDKVILYGCGDFVNDYEGIAGHEDFRGDLAVMYLPRLSALSGKLLTLRLVVFRMRKFRLERASRGDAMWLRSVLNREGGKFGTHVIISDDDTLTL